MRRMRAFKYLSDIVHQGENLPTATHPPTTHQHCAAQALMLQRE